MTDVSLGVVFLSEVVGSAMLLLLGCGVVANAILDKTKGYGTGTFFINWGWGIAVFAGVLVSYKSGGHLNPAVTVGLLVSGADTYAAGVPVTAASTLTYFAGEMVGAMIGAALMWVVYKDHFDHEPDPGKKLAVFATGPEIHRPLMNMVAEAVATFVLVFVIMGAGKFTKAAGEAANLGWLGAFGVALLVVGIGASLGGPTGYAINPTRDLGPRIMHAILPIKGKGDSNWGYAWVPVVGPLLGAIVAGLLSGVLLP